MPAIIINNDKSQRIMDSLARLLAVRKGITACTAVTFVEDKLLIVFNTPGDEDLYKVKDVENLIKERLKIIKEFLCEFNPDKAEDMVPCYIKSLLKHGKLGITTETKEINHGKKYSGAERIKIDLLKLAEFYSKGPSCDPKLGFSQVQRSTLMEAEPWIVYPDAEIEKDLDGKMHADQLIMLTAKQYYKERDIKHYKIRIGINKLPCQSCIEVLSTEKDTVSIRGESTVQYVNVINSITNKKTTSSFFPSGSSVVPVDSSSDPESVEISQLFKKKKNKIKKDSSASGGLLHPNSVMNTKSKKKSTFVDRLADTNKVSDANSLEPKGIIPSECVTGRNNSQEFIREKVSDGYDADIESDIIFDTKINSQKYNEKIKQDSDFNSTSEDRNLDFEYLTESKNNIACEKASSERCANTQSGLFGFFNKLYKFSFDQEENSMTVFGKMRVLG